MSQWRGVNIPLAHLKLLDGLIVYDYRDVAVSRGPSLLDNSCNLHGTRSPSHIKDDIAQTHIAQLCLFQPALDLSCRVFCFPIDQTAADDWCRDSFRSIDDFFDARDTERDVH